MAAHKMWTVSWEYTVNVWEEVKNNPMLKYAAVTTVTTISLVLLRRLISGGVCHSSVTLHGRTVVVTGANTGIGKETARDMARRGARVVLACRDMSKGQRAAEEIQRTTGNTDVVVRHLDLSSLMSVQLFVNEFLASEHRLDILINNAGVMLCPKSLSEDGFEMQLAVNHLGHFLLTNLLLDLLKSSAPSRVITVSSIAHHGGKIHFEDLHFEKTPYDALACYKQSKLANVLFTRELARRIRGTGVTCYSLHPGVVCTELGRHVWAHWPLMSALLTLPSLLLMKTPWQGAQTTIYCSVTEGLEDRNGCYFSDCRVQRAAPEGRDGLTGIRLWDVSSQLVDHYDN